MQLFLFAFLFSNVLTGTYRVDESVFKSKKEPKRMPNVIILLHIIIFISFFI